MMYKSRRSSSNFFPITEKEKSFDAHENRSLSMLLPRVQASRTGAALSQRTRTRDNTPEMLLSSPRDARGSSNPPPPSGPEPTLEVIFPGSRTLTDLAHGELVATCFICAPDHLSASVVSQK